MTFFCVQKSLRGLGFGRFMFPLFFGGVGFCLRYISAARLVKNAM